MIAHKVLRLDEITSTIPDPWLPEIMKPKIDLSNPRVQEFFRLYGDRATIAYNLTMSLEESVHPIYVLPKYRDTPQQLGSCVVLAIKNHTFLLSAAHVFEPIGPYAVLVGCGDRLHALTGDRFSSKQGPSGTHGDDSVDAAAFHITGEVPNEIRSCALSLSDIDLYAPHHESEFHVCVGYRISKSTRSRGKLSSQRDMYPGGEFPKSDYDLIGVDRSKNVALPFEDDIFINNKWQSAPVVRGMSGGAIFRISGLFANVAKLVDDHTARLTALIIERRPKKKDASPALIGARIGFHLSLINNFLPDLNLPYLLEYERAIGAKSPTP